MLLMHLLLPNQTLIVIQFRQNQNPHTLKSDNALRYFFSRW